MRVIFTEPYEKQLRIRYRIDGEVPGHEAAHQAETCHHISFEKL